MIDDLFWGMGGPSAGVGMGHVGGSSPIPRSESTSAEDVRHAMARIDKLTLITMSMWSLMREKTKLTEADLMERMKQIDLMDGTEDGKVTRQVAKCSSCDRVMNQRHNHCLYCGNESLIVTAFDTIT